MQNHKQSEHKRYAHFHQLLEPVFAGHLLAHAVRQNPTGTALIVNSTSLTYAALYEQAYHVSKLLHEQGIRTGDHVVILIDNSSFFYASYYGAWQLGAVVIPLNVFLQTHEIEHIIKDSHPRIIIVATALREKLAGIENLPPVLHEETISFPVTNSSSLDFSLLRARNPHETAVILYTSGTTGFPKGVMLTSQAIIANICQALARLDFMRDERILCPLPLFHSFTQNTCVWASIAINKTVILVPKITRTTLTQAIANRPTIVLGIPGLYGIFCRLSGISFSSVRYFVCGGEPLATNIRRFFSLRFGRTIANGYGLTETGPVISVDLDDFWKQTHNVGLPLPHIEYEIRNPDDHGIGTLWVKGPNLMSGYYNAPEATAHVLHEGWLNTGDMARIAPNGSIIIGGREKDIIVQKGIKIYPQEIETTLATHPQVVLAAVIGVPYGHEGEFPIAYVQLLEGSTTTPQELREHCLRRLAAYKVPRKIYLEQRLPMTATGKIDKKQLRQKPHE